MENSNISWTHNTWSPWIGCSHESEECLHCYAAALDSKYKYTQSGWGKGAPRKLRPDGAWREPLRWNREATNLGKRTRVFCASMADVFDPEVPPEWRARLFNLIAATPSLDWQILSKRPHLIQQQLQEIGIWHSLPWNNVWLGFSAGNQRNFDLRWPHLRDIAAPVRFCSYEPALGPLVLPSDTEGNLHWFICGGETTPKKGTGRKMLPEWARDVRDQCQQKQIAFFFKQWGNWIPTMEGHQRWFGKTSAFYRENGHLLDAAVWHQFPQPTNAHEDN